MLLCCILKEKLLVDLQKAVHGKNTKFHAGPPDLPILQTLQYHIPAMCRLLVEGSSERYCDYLLLVIGNMKVLRYSSVKFVLLQEHLDKAFLLFPSRCEWTGRLLGYVAVHCGENRAAEVLVHILQRATNTSQVKPYVSFCLEASCK